MLGSARGKTKLEIQEIVARLSPRPDVPASVRLLPSHAEAAQLIVASGVTAPPAAAPQLAAPKPAPGATIAPAPIPHAAVAPLSPERYKLQLTISRETLEKMRLAKDMLSHAIPTGDDAAILDRAFDALLEKLAKQKFAATDKPRASGATTGGGQDPPAAVQRAVWIRDLGRCRYIGPNGHRCEERRFVEFHHKDPRALGGEASIDLIELRCRRHNDYEGRLYFGKRRRAGL